MRGWRVCFRALRDARMCSRCGRGRARRAARSHRGQMPVGVRRGEGGRIGGLAAIALRAREERGVRSCYTSKGLVHVHQKGTDNGRGPKGSHAQHPHPLALKHALWLSSFGRYACLPPPSRAKSLTSHRTASPGSDFQRARNGRGGRPGGCPRGQVYTSVAREGSAGGGALPSRGRGGGIVRTA